MKTTGTTTAGRFGLVLLLALGLLLCLGVCAFADGGADWKSDREKV